MMFIFFWKKNQISKLGMMIFENDVDNRSFYNFYIFAALKNREKRNY